MKLLASDPNRSHHRNINLQELKLMVQNRATKSSNNFQKDGSLKNLSQSFDQPSTQNMTADMNKQNKKTVSSDNPQVKILTSY